MSSAQNIMRAHRAFKAVTITRALAAISLIALLACTTTPADDSTPPRQEPMKLVIEHQDGSVTFLSPLPMHLISHLQRVMAEADYPTLYDQLLSNEIKQRYVSRGVDPRQCLPWFEANRRDILILLSRVAGGINSPSIVYDQAGPIIRLSVYGRPAMSLRYKSVEVIREDGNYKLLLIN